MVSRLRRLWIPAISGATKELVAPLIQSLAHPMVAGDRRLQAERVASYIHDGSDIGQTIDICNMKDHATWSAIPGNHPGDRDVVALGLDLMALSGLVKLIRGGQLSSPSPGPPT